MTFVRQPSERWRNEVPGARWLKADLHVHTVDDHPGGRARWPSGLAGDPEDPKALKLYARRLLQAAAAAGIQALGLTPHSPKAGSGPDTSAVWHVVDEWNEGVDDDGIPFRDKLFAVFPGFEPSFSEHGGLHFLFLFDPEIGRELFLDLFAALMGGVSPWRGGCLENSSLTPEVALRTFSEFLKRQSPAGRWGSRPWNAVILAPHVNAANGLFGAKKARVLQYFEHEFLSGLELQDCHLPEDEHSKREWLAHGMAKYRHAFFHASDAYRVESSEVGEEPALGHRYTWLKMASPRVEALRQAFIASDSRLRIAYERGEDGNLREAAAPPSPPSYPCLRSVRVTGEAAFFGGKEGDSPVTTTFDLSPDLTCLIGGSMTGKSTLLDGLRTFLGAPPPNDGPLAREVRERATLRFLAGSPEVELACETAEDPWAPPLEQWPAQFFAQGELQYLSRDPSATKDILARRDPAETPIIAELEDQLDKIDGELIQLVGELAKLDDELDESAQGHQRALAAKEALDAFSEAGVTDMHAIAALREVWSGAARDGAALAERTTELVDEARALPELTLDENTVVVVGLQPRHVEAASPGELVASLEATQGAARQWINNVKTVVDALAEHEEWTRRRVEQALAARGVDAQKLREFDGLSRQAKLHPSYESNLARVRDRHDAAEERFRSLGVARGEAVSKLLAAYSRVADNVTEELGGRIRVRRVAAEDTTVLEAFLTGLQERGVTRWWNSYQEQANAVGPLVTPDLLLEALEGERLSVVGMSDAVAATFTEAMTRKTRRHLAALRCPDTYVLEMRVAEDEYRPIDELSGGQRVSLLLSLLLETRDDRPLVIDQPEDELDNSFLWDTLLPALRRLKGRRQVIVATHNANIVVNGDADQVILLKATAHHGRVAVAGAIEDPEVRQAIVETVDGGDEAFRLRRLKYGF